MTYISHIIHDLGELIFHICVTHPSSLLYPPHTETKYEQHFLRSLTVMEYLLKREECALICQGDLS